MMIRKDMFSKKDMNEVSTIYRTKGKKDFDIIIESISTVACLKKVDVKVMTSDGILSFARKNADDINKEYRRIETIRKYKKEKEEKARFW